jgi:hypothetical protein
MGRDWIHAALASRSRFLIDLRAGPRTLEVAAQLIATVAMACCGGGGGGRIKNLLLLIDDHLPYPNAILQVLGVVRHRRRRRLQGRGRRKHPDLKAPPGLWVGVVEKVRSATGRLIRVRTRALFGIKRRIVRLIKKLGIGRQINTSHLERLNGTLRTQQQARLGRRTRSVSRSPCALQWSLWLWRDLYNWVSVHASLEGRTPAMALGLADAPWSVKQYVQQAVHVSELQREIRAQERQSWLTSALEAGKRKKRLPTS